MNEDFYNKLEKIYEKEDGNTKAFEKEKPILEKVFNEIEKKLKDTYKFIEPIGRGGAGVIIRLKDKRLNLDRALKTPRPKEEIRGLIDSFRSEIGYLNKIRHENIISIYTFDNIKIDEYDFEYPYFVMEYIDDAKDIRKKVLELTNQGLDTKYLEGIMKWIVEKFYCISKAVKFLHTQQIIHFDIKPGNILIDKNDKPILSDLGFARKKSDKKTPIVVGFTLFYAHPRLKAEYFHMSSKNRVKKLIAPKDFEYSWDIYAFGKSLLEILSLVDSRFPDSVVYNYKFVYLHLAVCRMLDGRNLNDYEIKKIREREIQNDEIVSVYKETWLELDSSDFEEIKYKTFKKIIEDFEKIITKEHFLESIPELSSFNTKWIQCSLGKSAPFSKRVGYIISHPVFSRLGFVPQLGLHNYVYPTATHTRLEHSLGTFRNCYLYLRPLYYDAYNPLFRQLINKEDIKCILLASLLHDLGQYPLAHELGEANKKLRHENFTLKFLNNPTKDKFGKTIKDIIENDDWGWGVNYEKLKEILNEEITKKPLKINLLSSIINGPIDADKLDYLLRDSQNCYLKYGELIDIDRLIKNLTVIIYKPKKGKKILTIGTYEKGQSASESLTFARYLLYQSLYWHHTSRAVRCMLREAVQSALIKEKKGKQKFKTFLQQFENLLGISNFPTKINNNDILNLIKEWTDDNGINLIKMIEERNYYKRILTIHSYPQVPSGKESLLDKFRKAYDLPGFQQELQKKIRDRLKNQLAHTTSPKISLLSPGKTDDTLIILSQPKKIICDCPRPVIGSDVELRFIPEPHRLQKNYYIRADTGERVSEVWNQIFYNLMNIASKGRVFCHPEVRDTLMAALGPDSINECLLEVIKDYD